MLEVLNLRKSYGEILAVDDLSFTVGKGELVALLGPNGSGKTTVMRAVGATARIDSGRILVAGLDVAKNSRGVKAMIGVVHQEDTLDPDLSVRENLLVHARYFRISGAPAAARADVLLGRFGLERYRDMTILQLSGGLRRRLSLARAFFSARLLILDEPTTGLDPEAKLALWADLRQLLAEGVAILLTTHDMEEAERLSDRVILMDRGRKRSEGTSAELMKRFTSGRIFEIRVSVPRLGEAPGIERDLKALLSSEGEARVRRHGGFIFCETGAEARLHEWALGRGLALTVRAANLGDVYLAATGRILEE